MRGKGFYGKKLLQLQFGISSCTCFYKDTVAEQGQMNMKAAKGQVTK